MNKNLKIYGIAILFIVIGLFGCIDFTPEASKGKVVVTVIASATLLESLVNDTFVPNQKIDIIIQKKKGQTFEYSIATDFAGFVQCPPVVYNLYEKQFIAVDFF